MPQTVKDMRCEELVELVTDFLEGSLPAQERDQVEEHLRECEGCRNYVEQMRIVVRVLARLPERSYELPEDIKRSLLEQFRARK